MKSRIQIAALLFSFAIGIQIVSAETGEWRQSLNGKWQFATNTEAVVWNSIAVPGNWDTLPAYSIYKGKGWYRREFVAPEDWSGKHIRLKLDAVYHDATVTLNGKELGTHIGGYTPFEFEVTGVLKFGATNSVTVCADNTYRRGAWWHWGGISRSVTLIANNDARIVWQHIRTEPDLKSGEAKLFVRYKLANSGGKTVEASLAATIDGEKEPALTKSVSLPAHAEVEVEAATTLPKSRVRLWDFDHPNLYVLKTQLAADGKTVHEQSDRFGTRKVELTEDSLLLNGERVRLCGFNRVSDSRQFGNTEPDELVKADVDSMKRAGANLSRLMHFPQAPNLLDYLDEKGMMIWCEIPVWGGDDSFITNKDLSLPRQWMREMIERDYNHPCIIGWSVGNELRNHFNYVSNLMDYTRTLDPHRLVTHVSNSGAGGHATRTNDPITISPITLYNTYSYNKNAATIVHAKWPDKPIFFSEFGIKQFGGSPDSRIAGLEDMFRLAIEGNPYVIGVSLWTFNDYRSDFSGTPPSGNREWGIVTEDRKPKAAFEQVRKLFSPVHSLTVTNGFIRLEPRTPDEVPSFTLRGYKLKWIGGEISLPELKPGDAAWTSDAKVKPGTIVKLFTPTGYDVADSEY
jgi:beta-galactosidase